MNNYFYWDPASSQILLTDAEEIYKCRKTIDKLQEKFNAELKERAHQFQFDNAISEEEAEKLLIKGDDREKETNKKYTFSDSVNVLGETYQIKVAKRDAAPGFKKHPNAYGYCDQASKQIFIRDQIDDGDDEDKSMLITWMKKTLRHEIVHAYLFQSGLDHCSIVSGKWAMNEEMVDWFAIQGPKIMKSWKEAGCLD